MGSLGGMSPEGSIALGIIVGLLSTSVQSLGLTLQRKSHILEDEKGPLDVRRPPYRRRRWQLGMGMFLVANILGSSVQISTLPLPVLSTLQASGLVFNSLCASLILGEPFTRWSLWGTLLVSSGAVLIAIFGAIPAPTHNLSELLELFSRKGFIVWMSLQVVFVVTICVLVEVVHVVSSLSKNLRFRLVRGLTFGCISGILSAHSLLMAKSAVELVIKTIVDRDNQFVRWQAWVILLALVFLALTQLYYLHRGLKLISTSVLYPLVFCVYNIIAILDGLIYFRQTELITPLRACLITLGTVILLSGVLALSWRLSDEQHTPGVGQSSLAPGLGLVDDTDGEEEEELLLGSDTEGREDDVLPATYASYQTFNPEQRENGILVQATPLTPRRQRRPSLVGSTLSRAGSRWAERAEIWGELDDQDVPPSPLPTSSTFASRRRSTTLPVLSESASLLLPARQQQQHQRVASTGEVVDLGGPSGSAGSLDRPHRAWRRRRKSTGFPGFTARRTDRRKSSSGGGALQDALGGVLRLRWWGDKGGKQRSASAEEGQAVLPYRDDPDGRGGGSSVGEGGGPANAGGPSSSV
ncbi:DUF803 domain-containing protein [Pleurostoma richardsiae]|uniref:DUF803 domain-containing protein n=1 Tax=Pleurostoma richardsiae TaxID=41990 RepID=A0AA38VVG7_9PEZI|nr:DUF803 domain-containing protein [Pleurostoma richardsiae]